MINYLQAQFDKGEEKISDEVPLVYNIGDDGTKVEDAVSDASNAVESAEQEKEELEIAAA